MHVSFLLSLDATYARLVTSAMARWPRPPAA